MRPYCGGAGAHAIVATLSVLGHGVGAPATVRPPTDVVEAYTLYLRGRYFILKGDADSLRVALEYFEQALELDPQFALTRWRGTVLGSQRV